MKAIILARRDFREYDQIISVYTVEHGMQELLAKGVKKSISKNTAHLEPFSVVELGVAPGKGFTYITSVQGLHFFAGIRTQSLKSMAAQYVVSLVHSITKEDESDVRVFDFLISWLLALEKSTVRPGLLLDVCVLRLLSLFGFEPNLTAPLANTYLFSLKNGVIVFEITADDRTVNLSESVRIVICHFLKGPSGSISLNAQDALELHAFVHNMAEFYLERHIADWGMLEAYGEHPAGS